MIAYAQKRGYERIAIITNGIKIADKEYYRSLTDAGLNDILFSIHGPNAKMHEEAVGVPKSFSLLLKALDNIKESEARLRTNTTVTSENYQTLPEFANFINPYKPFAINFILFNNFFSPQSQKNLMPDFEKASKSIKEAIDSSFSSYPQDNS